MQNLSGRVENFKLALGLERGIVGVKFLFDEKEFNKAESRSVKGKMPYCVMVRKGMLGYDMKVTKENSGCVGAENALGIAPLTKEFMTGRTYRDGDFYKDLTTARNVIHNSSRFDFETYGIEIKPLEQFTYDPDVVLMVGNPYQAMRIVQSYGYVYGGDFSIKTVGNQAVCSECTANPYKKNSINISFLCSGTRYNNRWKDEELMIGLAFNKFEGLAESVHSTLDTFESDEKKKDIEDNFRKQGIDYKTEKNAGYFYKKKEGV